MPCLAHGIQDLFQDGFSTFGAFWGVFVFVTGFAPGVFVADNERCCCAKGLEVSLKSTEKDEVGSCGERLGMDDGGQGQGGKEGEGRDVTSPQPAQKKWPTRLVLVKKERKSREQCVEGVIRGVIVLRLILRRVISRK